MFRKIVITFKQFSYRSFSTPLGYIGLGSGMGIEYARRLIEAGVKLTVYDIKKDRIETLVKQGAIGATNPGEVAANCDILFTSLPDMKGILNILEGPNGVLKNAKNGLLLVDFTTIGPVNAHRLQSGFQTDNKIQFLSAPISGSYKQGAESRLRFLVGGKKEYMERIDKYMKVIAAREKAYVSYIGPDIGDGQAARMCNLLLTAATMVAVCEVMSVGRKLGLNPNILAEVLNSTSSQCWACEHYNPVPGVSKNAPSNRKYALGHPMFRFYRSLSVAQEMAIQLRAPIPTVTSALQMYTLALCKGFGQQDFSAVIKIFKHSIIEQE